MDWISFLFGAMTVITAEFIVVAVLVIRTYNKRK